MPGEGLPTRVRVMLIEHQVSFRRLMAALLDRGPGPGVVAQAGSLTEARRRTAMVRFDLTVLDLVAALQALTEPARRVFFGFTGQSRKAKHPRFGLKITRRGRQCYVDTRVILTPL